MRKFAGKFLFATCLCVGTAGFVSAQGPAPGQAPGAGGAARGGGGPQNLKVLPKTWSGQQVRQLMLTFTESLGVQCVHCHAESTTAPPTARGPVLDYASDGKQEKDVARKMIQMVMAVNDTYLKDVGDSSTPEKVSCYTCHQGQQQPATAPPNGWARGSFSLSTEGPAVPARRGGAPPAGN